MSAYFLLKKTKLINLNFFSEIMLIKKVILILAAIFLFSSIIQTYTLITLTGEATQGTVSLMIVPPCTPPSYLSISLNVDNESADLNWTYVSTANSYNIYYSSNISAIMTLDLNNIPLDVIKIENITATNWTDWNASEVQKRYYTVSTVQINTECLTSDIPVGKFTYYYDAPYSSIYGTLASNRIALYLNVSYNAESFLQEIPGNLNPTISRLDKTNASGEYLTTHVRGLDDGNNFPLYISIGYQITVDDYFNQTIAGKVYIPPYILYYDVPNSSTYGILATNLRGIWDFNKTYDAESFLQEIPGNLNPTISRLDKTNASGEYLTTHVRGLNDGNNFGMNLGVGYAITVDDYHNQTLCTNCFG